MIQKYPSTELCVTTLDQIFTISSTYDLFYIKSSQFIVYELHETEVLRILLEPIIDSIEIYGSVGIRYINKMIFNYQNAFAQKIQKRWRKYRIQTARIRNDLVLHGLAEYFYHPSRVNFEDPLKV